MSRKLETFLANKEVLSSLPLGAGKTAVTKELPSSHNSLTASCRGTGKMVVLPPGCGKARKPHCNWEMSDVIEPGIVASEKSYEQRD